MRSMSCVSRTMRQLDLPPGAFLYSDIVKIDFAIRASVLALLVWSAIFGSSGCGSKEVQYPEDHERYLRIDKAVETLRQSYVKKNSSALSALMIPIDQLERLQRDAESDFETFQAITLEFRIERVMIEGEDVDVYVHWQGVWKKDPEDPGLRQRGHTRLQWVGTKAILLRGFQGDAPFGMKGRQSSTDSPPPKK
ncbi:MAG TPA: hypothetical protein VIU63_11385 [Nitrospira sp.]